MPVPKRRVILNIISVPIATETLVETHSLTPIFWCISNSGECVHRTFASVSICIVFLYKYLLPTRAALTIS